MTTPKAPTEGALHLCGRVTGYEAGQCGVGLPHVYGQEEECWRLGYLRAEATVERLLDDAETVVWELVLIEQDGTDELRPPRGGSLGWYCANGAIEVLKALRTAAKEHSK